MRFAADREVWASAGEKLLRYLPLPIQHARCAVWAKWSHPLRAQAKWILAVYLVQRGIDHTASYCADMRWQCHGICAYAAMSADRVLGVSGCGSSV